MGTDDNNYAALWQPINIGGVEVCNRIMTTAMTLQFGEGGGISDRHVAFYRERARGGVGLMLSEQLTASRLNDSGFTSALTAYNRNHIPGFSRIVAAVQPYGARYFTQLFAPGAAGASASGIDSWAPLKAPSRVAAPGMESPAPLTIDELAQIVDDFADSAHNMQEAGVHGVELHGSHGWLIGQFLSPFYNRRTDQYGGSVDNRCRFAIEIGRAVRAKVGADYPLGIALSYDELMGEAGITPEDTLDQLRVLDTAGLFNFFDLSVGSSHQQHHTLASMAVGQGFAIPFAARAKKVVRDQSVIMVAGRVVKPVMAARAVELGHADIVAMTRGMLADPQVLKKTRAGQHHLITHCVGANVCIRRSLGDQPVACVVNPVAGREQHWAELLPAARQLRIAVVGAGPAGLRFAGTAARRGHNVSVIEQRAAAGGHLAPLAVLPAREGWAVAISDMLNYCHDAGVRFQFNHSVTAGRGLSGDWDAVVVATGSNWDMTGNMSARYDRLGIPGLESTRTLSPDQAIAALQLNPTYTLGDTVMVVDGVGTYVPLGIADLITSRGANVVLVTPLESLGRHVSAEQETPHIMPKLFERRFESHIACDVEQVNGRTVLLRSIWGGKNKRIEGVEAIVMATARASDETVYEQLRARHRSVHRIGDCVSPRSLEAVIFEAEQLARTL